MDDLTAAISQILQNPESMQQLRAAAQALGLNPDGPPPSGFESAFGAGAGAPAPPPAPASPPAYPPPTPAPAYGQQQPQAPSGQMPDLSALAGLLGGLGGGNVGAGQGSALPSIDPATLKLIGRAVSKLNSSDKNVDLLRALKPHVSVGRAGRVDDAIRMLQLFSMLPLLRESGLLNRFLGGGDNK